MPRTNSLRVLVVTNDWPTFEHPEWATFIVDQVEGLRKEGVDVRVFPFHGGKNIFRYVSAWIKLRMHLFQNNFDLIHAHFGQSGLLCLPKIRPLIITFHGSDLQGYIGSNGAYSSWSNLLLTISRFAARQADHCIVVAEHLRKLLPANLSISTIPCGVDFDLFRPMQKEDACRKIGLDIGKHYVLFPANPLRRVKRFSLAQQSMEILQRKHPTAEMLVLSDVPHDMVPYYLNASDAVILTSFHEGSPTIVKEALACNTPIVSVDVGDVRVITQNINGCSICRDDGESIAAALDHVLTHPIKIDGREKIQYFAQQKIVSRILELYETVCDS